MATLSAHVSMTDLYVAVGLAVVAYVENRTGHTLYRALAGAVAVNAGLRFGLSAAGLSGFRVLKVGAWLAACAWFDAETALFDYKDTDADDRKFFTAITMAARSVAARPAAAVGGLVILVTNV